MPDLMVCALPYHATGEFVRLVQIMPLDGTVWAFLRPMQKSGAPLPRPVLVRRCANDLVSTRAASCLLGSGRLRLGQTCTFDLSSFVHGPTMRLRWLHACCKHERAVSALMTPPASRS